MPTPTTKKYRLLAGGHIQKGPDGKDEYYLAPDVFHSRHDLLRFNARGFPPKFELAHHSDPVSVPRNKRPRPGDDAEAATDEGADTPAVASVAPGGTAATLQAMTLEELLAFADQEGIKLPNLARTKRDKVLEYLAARV